MGTDPLPEALHVSSSPLTPFDSAQLLPHTQATRTLHRRTRRSPWCLLSTCTQFWPAVAPQATLGSTQHSSSGSRELHCSPALHLSSFLVAVSEFSFKSQKVKNQSLSLSSWSIYLRSQRKHGLRSTSILSTKYKIKSKISNTVCIVFEILKFIQMTFFFP